MEEGVCESCSAKILFVTDQDGTKHPLNKRRVRVYYRDGRGWHYKTTTELLKGKVDQVKFVPDLYHISHYTTCPHPERHSKRPRT